MTSATQAYTYAAPSSLVDGRLGLATSGGRALSGPAVAPRFFSGVVTQAAPAAAALLGVADAALARYHQPQARPGWVRDPVVTCNGDRLRFESFSACGGVYARLDLLNGALDGEVFDRGTTNVDVNAPLREALARIGARDPLHLGVGLDEPAVTTMDGAMVEKKAPLPEHWLRGFAEVQVIASGTDQRGGLTGMAAVRFLRGLPAEAIGRQLALVLRRTWRETRPAIAALTELTNAGGHHEVWRILRALLPGMLPGEGQRITVTHAELVAFAADVARRTGARGEIPVVAEFAQSRRTIRFVHECKRLHAQLTGATS